MKPCNRVGINITWKCNWRCTSCFYRYFDELHAGGHRNLDELKLELSQALLRGCKHMVGVGYGEPTLSPVFADFVRYCKEVGMSSSVITNGAVGIPVYEKLIESGIDHFHVSVHGLGNTLDQITETQGASKRQEEFKHWLSVNGVLFRTNTTLQKLNYKELPKIVDNCLVHGAFHVVLLGFLPHYHWKNRLHEVAVHPAQLRPYVEAAADILTDANSLFTIRYHPFCHLASKYWKHVTNTLYVLFDPWEWDYKEYCEDIEKVWKAAEQMRDTVAIQGSPCSECVMWLHCGGWNRFYVQGFGGADLEAIKDVPDEYKEMAQVRGGIFDMNPANATKYTHI